MSVSEQARAPTLPARARRIAPGLGLAAVIAAAAFGCEALIGGPAALYAMAIALAAASIPGLKPPPEGLAFASSLILRLGVALLGLRISAQHVMEVGLVGAGVVLAGMACVFILSRALAPALGLSPAFGLVSATSVSVCGVSAALTAASVMPAGRVRDEEVAMVCLTVTLLSTVAMALYPALTLLLRLDAHQAGVFLGGSIHDVAQVVAAGFILGDAQGDAATITKLFRVAMLAPISVALAVAVAQGAQAGSPGGLWRTAKLPWFLLLFLAFAALRSLGLVPPEASKAASEISKIFLVTAVAAIGLKTGVAAIARAGWRPLSLILAQTAALGAVVLTGAALLV